jgi:hypothetical protein
MTYKVIIITLLLVGLNTVMAAPAATEPNAAFQKPVTTAEKPDAEVAEEAAVAQELVLPPKDSTQYWVIRSEAISEFVPLLTKKRTEVKMKLQLLADYLLKIDKASEFAGRNMPVTFDAKVYLDILQMGEGLRQMNMELPKERPSWDALVEVVMKYVLYDGYLPTDVEEGDDAAVYIEACKKKEEYGQKVRQDIRTVLDQAAKIWVYLDSIKELDNFKAYAADLILEKKAAKAQEKAMYTEAHRQEVLAQAKEKQQREFETAESRAEWRSGRRERAYDSYQDNLQYRQSRLDERFVNSRAYYY